MRGKNKYRSAPKPTVSNDGRDDLSVYLAGGVDIPPELNRALEEGELVLFIGAGASFDAPSSLPDFGGLTAELLKLAGSNAQLVDDGRYDIQLGDLSDSDFDVAAGVRQVIGRPDSVPNRWHQAIANLFKDPQATRIVTTNYDLHLESALGEGIDVWQSPALPLGHSFTGVVHLHGSLAGANDGFVVTDRQFGRAYMTEGWAGRFVVSVFQRFHVLFAGYSYNDLVMQYLARGLPPDQHIRRWALVGPNDVQRWDRYRIDPIPWDTDVSDEYGPGVAALVDWGKRTWWTPLQHVNRISDLVAGGPLLDPVDENYLTRVLANESRVSFFCQKADGVEWLNWIKQKQAFRELCRPDHVLSPAQERLAIWFADKYVTLGIGNPLGVLAEMGGDLSQGLWRAIARALWNPSGTWLGDRDAWLITILNSPHRGSDDTVLNYIFKDLELPRDRNAFLLLLRALFTPRVVIRPGLTLPGSPQQFRVDLNVLADDHWVDEVIRDVLVPNVNEMGADIYAIATSLLTEYHQIYRAFGQGSDDYDPMDWQRSAIEPHRQDRHNSPAMRIIDIARESAKSLADQRSSEEIARDLLDRRTPLLTRLAAWIISEA